MKKKILIIGGNSDIIFHTSSNFLNISKEIVFLSKNMDGLSLKINQLKIKNQNVEFKKFHFDISNLNECFKILNKNIDSNIIIFSAGYLENPEDNIEMLIDINYKNIVILNEWIIKNFQNTEDIIFLTSIAADRGKSTNNIYSSAKSGLSNYVEGLTQRMNKKKINILEIKPGYVSTKMTKNLKLPKYLISNPEYVGRSIYNSFLKKKNCSYIPFYWKYIMFIFKLIPTSIFKKLNF